MTQSQQPCIYCTCHKHTLDSTILHALWNVLMTYKISCSHDLISVVFVSWQIWSTMKASKLLRNFGRQWSIAESEFHGITPKPSCFLRVSAALASNLCGSGHSFKNVAHPCSRVCKSCVYPTGREFSLEFRFHHFANGKFAKFKFCLLLHYINL